MRLKGDGAAELQTRSSAHLVVSRNQRNQEVVRLTWTDKTHRIRAPSLQTETRFLEALLQACTLNTSSSSVTLHPRLRANQNSRLHRPSSSGAQRINCHSSSSSSKPAT